MYDLRPAALVHRVQTVQGTRAVTRTLWQSQRGRYFLVTDHGDGSAAEIKIYWFRWTAMWWLLSAQASPGVLSAYFPGSTFTSQDQHARDEPANQGEEPPMQRTRSSLARGIDGCMSPLDSAMLTMHNELGNLGWVLSKQSRQGAIAIYYRVRDGKVERAAMILEGSVFRLKPLDNPH